MLKFYLFNIFNDCNFVLKLKMKTGKKPKKLEVVDKKQVNENEKAENKDVDLDIVPLPL